MEYVIQCRPYFELLYFSSSILLVIIAFYGLKQIKILKSDLEYRSERSSKEKAIDVATEYLGPYCELCDEECKACESDQSRKCPDCIYNGEIGDFSYESLNKEQLEIVKRTFTDGRRRCLNNLESLSAVLVTGVGDEKTAFTIIGKSFCETIEYHYDKISLFRDGNNEVWSNMIKIYKTWSPRLSKEKLQKQEKDIKEKIDSIKETTIPALKPTL